MKLALQRSDGVRICSRCLVDDDTGRRARQLLGRTTFGPDEGLYVAMSSIRTYFAQSPIDAVFVDSDLRVVRVVHRLRPWRIARSRGARGVIGLEAGVCDRIGLDVGDRLSLLSPEAADGAAAGARNIRVAVSTPDRRFSRVASFLLSRDGFSVEAQRDSERPTELAKAGDVDVVLLDASDSLVSAARTARTIKALAPGVGLVLVVAGETNGNGNGATASHAGQLDTVPKWGSFDAVVAAIERSYASTKLGQLA